jgi:hypothetical protein
MSQDWQKVKVSVLVAMWPVGQEAATEKSIFRATVMGKIENKSFHEESNGSGIRRAKVEGRTAAESHK